MKLLFDHNLPPQLVKRLSGVFPNADHVATSYSADIPPINDSGTICVQGWLRRAATLRPTM